jgi:hypothetical protein
MGRRPFDGALKIEAVKLGRERGLSAAQAPPGCARERMYYKWVGEFAADPRQAFPWRGWMKLRAVGGGADET